MIVPRDTTGFHEAASSRPLKYRQSTTVNDAAMKNRCTLQRKPYKAKQFVSHRPLKVAQFDSKTHLEEKFPVFLAFSSAFAFKV